MAISPGLKRIRSRSAAGMSFHLVRRTIDDIHMPAIALPAGPAGCGSIMRIGKRDAPVVFGFKFVFRRAWRGIAPQPELLDELRALGIACQFFEGGAFLVADDIHHVLIEPFRKGRFR